MKDKSQPILQGIHTCLQTTIKAKKALKAAVAPAVSMVQKVSLAGDAASPAKDAESASLLLHKAVKAGSVRFKDIAVETGLGNFHKNDACSTQNLCTL